MNTAVIVGIWALVGGQLAAYSKLVDIYKELRIIRMRLKKDGS
jgi:hypothetical protein